jgi:YHS domain-containing protein
MIDYSRRRLLASTLVLFTTTGFAAEDEIYTSFFSSVGADGYDVVAYFSESKPVEGNKKFATEYKNVDWYFSNEENLSAFKENPESFAPQYGGYCAWAVANGTTASGDPLQWAVVNNKLYLNYDAEIQAMWAADRDNLIVKGDMNWPSVLN